jgi:4-hydroxy-3-polyprenylbenzoate decarboxylase
VAKLKSATIAITGASGIVYGLRTIEVFSLYEIELNIVYTRGAIAVASSEVGIDLRKFLEETARGKGEKIKVYFEDQIEAPIASSSNVDDAFVVVPCSMKTLSHIAYGISENLVSRAALNALRMRRPVVLVPRETPLGYAEIYAMLRAHEAGAVILPAMPAFYTKPKSVNDMVDFIVGKILDVLGIDNSLYQRWKGGYQDRNI